MEEGMREAHGHAEKNLQEPYGYAEKSVEGPGLSAARLSPLNLAYIGDSVMDLIVRTELVRGANEPVHVLHKKASAVVNASRQSRMAGVLEADFTKEEAAVYRRGRNARSATRPKNAGILEYRRATGLEAVFGFLFLKGEYDRLLELYQKGKSLTDPDREA